MLSWPTRFFPPQVVPLTGSRQAASTNKSCSLRRSTFNSDPAVVAFHNSVSHRKPQTGSFTALFTTDRLAASFFRLVAEKPARFFSCCKVFASTEFISILTPPAVYMRYYPLQTRAE